MRGVVQATMRRMRGEEGAVSGGVSRRDGPVVQPEWGAPVPLDPRGEDTGEVDPSTCDSEGTLRRTVFCGNIPVGTTRRALERFFRAAGCGAVASSRLRSCAPERLGVPKRAAILGGALHPARGSLNGYVVFREAASVACALQRNGAVFAGPDGRACHLRVDRCWMPPQRARAKKGHAVQGAVGVELDHRHSIFLGNVPYDASEEELRALFADCGRITNVRIVRDGRTGMGKGFAYVTFTPESNVDLALARHAAVQVRGRALRVMRSSARLATKRQREEHPYVSENRRDDGGSKRQRKGGRFTTRGDHVLGGSPSHRHSGKTHATATDDHRAPRTASHLSTLRQHRRPQRTRSATALSRTERRQKRIRKEKTRARKAARGKPSFVARR
ncbi:hypothetical protein CDCA_CDCA08G2540 [Cyanidium caldarium]|uniref:RRM domain-containing protein n=1 Tax=Cyanidium caldarium TaxID=2771 RepID=A0AAV9IWM0_CYACA|nr:hypothetical protein CDCA_CDCA08G2540 [Cyanidium caldarium]